MYYVNSKLKIATYTAVHQQAEYERLCGAITEVQDLLSNLPWSLPKDYEIQLQLDTDSPRCGYYAVDHEMQTEFWLHDVDTYNNLGIDRVSSKHNLSQFVYCTKGTGTHTLICRLQAPTTLLVPH